MTRKTVLNPGNRPRSAPKHARKGRKSGRNGPKTLRTGVIGGSEQPQAGWRDLSDELDRWRAAGRVANLWWRDDDAVAASPALERLLALAAGRAGTALPLALAVIPACAGPGLAARLRQARHVTVLQHGWAHANHAPAAERTIELGSHRPAPAVLAELADGRQRLARLFGRQFLPVIVPPWNRIAPAIAGALPGAGYRGLSSQGPRGGRSAPDFVVANVHIDIFRWRPRAGFIGEALALGQTVRHLAARRHRHVDTDEPTGLMTHHLQHDADCWAFLERFLAVTAQHPAVQYRPAGAIFAPGGAR